MRVESGASLKTIASQLKVTRYLIRKTLRSLSGDEILGHLEAKSSAGLGSRKALKISLAAEDALWSFVKDAQEPVVLRDLQKLLTSRVGLKVSLNTIRKFVRERLGMSYRLIQPTSKRQNSSECVLQR